MVIRRLAVIPAAAAALALASALPAAASPARARPLPCRATMSNARPADFTTVFVQVRTASRAGVVTVAHFKTTSHRKTARASVAGRARVPYSISDATPGFRVKVSVSVTRNGRRGSCATSFTPHRR